MGDLGKDVSIQLSMGVNVTLVRVMCGSPAGMGQLIKYFESQSRRLDRQMYHAHPPSFNPDFESAIKFNGVPILPPALTSTRCEELRQYKKDAILLEKRLKARQRRQLLAKADSLVSGSQVAFPDTGSRPAARQLNFDQDGPGEMEPSNQSQDRLGATDPRSTFATAETEMALEDFGLQTLDSLNSDFMSLDEGAVPRVFNGLVLTSAKEQKISYDLDRLSKALNVQELTSTSGSDISDALGSTQYHEEADLQNAQKLAEKLLAQRKMDGQDASSASFFHESQDTVVEVSPQAGDSALSVDQSSTSGFVENTNSSNLEQSHNSLGSSPSCGSANTTATIDSQKSHRSSPKSLKNAVHFASFVTEYINTSASQSFESTTIVKKKMSSDSAQSKQGSKTVDESGTVLPIIGDPSEARQRNLSRKSNDSENAGSMLDKVHLNLESDSSPSTPPFDVQTGMPFQNYGRSEQYNSDKENDASRLHKSSHHAHKKPTDRTGQGRNQVSEKGMTESHPHGHRQAWPSDGGKHNSVVHNDYRRNNESENMTNNVTALQLSVHRAAVASAIASGGTGSQDLQSVATSVGASQVSSSGDSAMLVSVSQMSGSSASGTISAGKASVSDSQGSNKSAGMSESSSSTIKDDQSCKETTNLAMNIVDSGNGLANINLRSEEKQSHLASQTDAIGNSQKDAKSNINISDQTHSPKKLNTTNTSNTPADLGAGGATSPRTLIRRGSYTLSEPSPALIKARSKLEAQQKENSEPYTNTGTADNKNQSVMDSPIQQGSPSLQGPPTQPTNMPVQAAMATQVEKDNVEKSVNNSVPSQAEREGKAEHINKYLNQVQFQNSMNFSSQSWDVSHVSASETNDEGQDNEMADVYHSGDDFGDDINDDPHLSVLDVLRSIAESQGSLDQLSVEELLALHQQQMEAKKQALIKSQQRDMEELFIQQRREVMLLEAEIKAAQQQEREQQEFLIQNAPENIKVKARNHEGEYSPEHTGDFEHRGDLSVQQQRSLNSLDNLRPQSGHSHRMLSIDQSGAPNLKLQPKSYPGVNARTSKSGQNYLKSQLKKNNNIVASSSPAQMIDDQQTQVKSIADDSFSPRACPPMDIVGLANKIPEFSPSASSPRVHHPSVFRSPLKDTSLQKGYDRVVVPLEAHLPENQRKFAQLSAVAKGFLTRCLLRSAKVQELIKTIKDTREFAFNFQTETPIKKGAFTPQDRALLERIVAQLQAALLDIHDIFFEMPCSERMALIEQTRMKEQEKRVKALSDSMRGSGPRISQATLKALERKRKAREAEASAMLSTSRPRTAPPATSSPRCNNHTDVRALKPLQGQSHSQMAPTTRPDTSRSEKNQPQTAPEKQLTRPKRITAPSVKLSAATSSSESHKGAQKESANRQATVLLSKTVMKSKVAPTKPSSSRPTKSWR